MTQVYFVQPIQPDKPTALEAAQNVQSILQDDYPDKDWYFTLGDGYSRFTCEGIIDDVRVGFSLTVENVLMQTQSAQKTADGIAAIVAEKWVA